MSILEKSSDDDITNSYCQIENLLHVMRRTQISYL